jgi:AcrR family transcriptional regulator
MSPTTESSRRRRSQAERSATTRQALLDATIRCLIEEGYASTTTARIAERAGVSRGAHLPHFQTRSALVAAAIEHLARRRGEELRATVDTLPSGRGRTAAGLDLLWSSYASPMSQAALDLWAAGRTDAELREHLVPFERAMDRHTMELARRLFPDAAAREDFDEVVEFILATIRGLSLLDTLHPGGGRNARQWETVRPRLLALLDG